MKNVLLKYPSLAELKDCMEEHASSDIMAFLEEGIDELECTTISEENLYDAISALCDKNSEGVSFSDIEGNNSPGASFTLKDLDETLPITNGIDAVFSDYINGIINTNECSEEYIEELKNLYKDNNCDLSSFSSAFRDYFAITESTEQQTVPTIGIGDILCPNMFTVTPVQDNLHVSAGVSGLNFQVMNSDGISISHPHIQIMMVQNIGACINDYTHASIMAEAMNAAIAELRILMGDYQSYEELNNALDFGDDSVVDDAFQIILGQKIDNIYISCGEFPSAGPILSLNTQWGDKCFTIYNQLSQNNINGCP